MTRNNITKPIVLTPDDLLLDPNNPRLADDFETPLNVADKDLLKAQSNLEKRFKETGGEIGDCTDIYDLYEAMKIIGYVAGCDRIVVREIEGINKYLVIEGNRRVATIKRILKNAENFHGDELVAFKPIANTFKTLEVVALDTNGLTPSEIQDHISIILGLRHFGSLKEWSAINAAFNAYQNYMNIHPALETFTADSQRTKSVASKLGITTAKVRILLKTYVVYLQLTKVNNHVRDDHFSLIEAAITLANKYKYFKQDSDTLKFSEKSLTHMQALCQFESRRELRKQPRKLIIPKSQTFTRLGNLIKHQKNHENEAIRQRAENLIDLVGSGEVDEKGNLLMTVELANSLLTTEINRKEWVDSLSKLLDQQADELPIEQYKNEGNHLLAKESLLKGSYRHIAKLLS
jgi:hypothetical protein